MCLKSDQNEAALDELKQVEDLERALYGENSTKLGKTYKVIGTIHLLNKNHSEAREYLLKAQSIFEQKGLLKLLKEVKQKLKLMNPNKLNQLMNEGMNAAHMLGVGGLAGDSDNDGFGDGTPEQIMNKRKVMGAGSKKPLKKKASG